MFVIVALLALGLFWCYRTYPRIGHWLYDASSALEARLYRLKKHPVAIDGMTLATYMGGPTTASQTLLLLHGYSADKSIWLRFARHFSNDCRVLIPDLGGHGATGFDASQDYSIPAQGRRLLQLLDACQVARVHLVGNSMGGYIAAWLAATSPERVASLTLFDPAGVSAPEPSDLERMLAAGRNPFLIDTRADFDTFYGMTMADPPWVPEVVLAAIAERYRQRRPQLAKIFDDFHGSAPMEPLLGSIQAPTLLLWGREDRLLHASSALIWARGIPQLQVEIWQGIGHMPMVERPNRSARLYRQFLQQAALRNSR